MSHIEQLTNIAATNQNHDGHIARRILTAIEAVQTGSMTRIQAKILLANLLKEYKYAGDLTDRQTIFDTIQNLKNSNLISL